MDVQTWTYLLVGITFALYIGIAIWSRAGSTSEFYVAGGGVPALANGMATAADWMSAASFISMAGLISFQGYDGSVFLMGWTGGYVLLALLLAPYLRKFGQFTVPDFVGDRYYCRTARLVALFCAIFISFTYVCGQMRGVGVVFSRFLFSEVEGPMWFGFEPITWGVLIGMTVVFFYAVLGGMKGITYTQVAQYCVLIFAFMVPAIFISLMMTGNPIPQIGLGSEVTGEGVYLLDKLDGLNQELGFAAYTDGSKSMQDIFFITMALMVGTAGLPHVIIRFYTVKKVSAARVSAFWALLFIAILYTTAPAVSAFARTNLLQSVPNKAYSEAPAWLKSWENAGLIAWMDKNNDGIIQYAPGKVFEGTPAFSGNDRGENEERLLTNTPTDEANELYVDQDIMVLANPEIAKLPNWVVALVAAGGLAAALSTAAGLLLVISTSVSHDLVKKTFAPGISDKKELLIARCAAGVAVVIAGFFGVYPPGFVASVVAFAFGLAAASFFPVIILGIFSKRMNREGAILGMVVGIVFTAGYIIFFKFISPELNTKENWLFGISPEGIGTLGMIINFAVSLVVSRFTPAPPKDVVAMIESIRQPEAEGEELAVMDH
ncbi:MAG: cation acetate symporter [Verrucomicrobiales bacterium]|nr:cation acetate symporter [Verrucomicrobiales bacterium]